MGDGACVRVCGGLGKLSKRTNYIVSVQSVQCMFITTLVIKLAIIINWKL